MKKLIAGNWKMFGSYDMAESFDEAMHSVITNYNNLEWLICAPFPYIPSLSNVTRGAQNCSFEIEGAFTGEISARMISDMQCEYCIVGHSERRTIFSETNDIVAKKAELLLSQNVKPIICVGETLEQRESGHAFDVVKNQIIESMPSSSTAKNTVIAYEPVWAIGTGKAATVQDVLEMHAMIRNLVNSKLDNGAEMRIIYGGSVKPTNAAELLNLDNVDGALIGGASLKIEDFVAIGAAVKN